MSEAIKYTDQDVRNNPDFYGIVVNYLVDYPGEFQFLIDCKMRIASGMDLTTGMVRGVLNCMRVDPRVKDLPEPMDWPDDVIPIDKSYRRPKKRRKVPCTRTDFHIHQFADWETYEYCPGKYEYNRIGRYRLPATVHPEYVFVKGKSAATKTVHLVVSAEMEWVPNQHEAGFYKNELIVHTACRYPYYLRNPKLLTVEMIDETDDLYRCGHCMPEDSDHE